MRNILIDCAGINRVRRCLVNSRIVSVVDDDIGTATFFHEALRQNIDGISVFSFIDPVKAFEHFTENKENYALVISDLKSRHLNILQRTRRTMH